jgi:hypothetical protein
MSFLRAIFTFLYELIFGCSHERVTRPFTLDEMTYKVCLDCGKHVYYSPITMRPLTSREVRHMLAAQAGEVRIMPADATGTNGPLLVPARARKSNAA